MKVRELVEQLLDHHPDAEVHFCWNGVVHRAIEQAVEGRVIEGQGGLLLRLDKLDWGKYPAARASFCCKMNTKKQESNARIRRRRPRHPRGAGRLVGAATDRKGARSVALALAMALSSSASRRRRSRSRCSGIGGSSRGSDAFRRPEPT